MKEPKKRKRLVAKIITVVCCLSIVLTLTIVPCFASGFEFYSGDRYYYGVPYTLTGVYGPTYGASIYIDDAMCIVATDIQSVVNSGVSYHNTGNIGSIYNYGMSIVSYCPVNGIGGGYNNAISFSTPGETIKNKLINHYFIDVEIGDVLSSNSLSYNSLITDRINSLSTYNSLYGVDYVNLFYDGVIDLGDTSSSGVGVNFYFETLSDGSVHSNYSLRFDISCDVYYYDDFEGYLEDSYTGTYMSNPNWNTTNSSLMFSSRINEVYLSLFDVRLYMASVSPSNIYNYILSSYSDYDYVFADNLSINVSVIERSPAFTSNPLLSDIKGYYGNPSIVSSGWGTAGSSVYSNIIDNWDNNFHVTMSEAPSYEYVSLDDFNLTDWLGDTLGGVMSTRIIGPITIGSVLYVAVGVGFVMLVLKFFAGG